MATTFPAKVRLVVDRVSTALRAANDGAQRFRTLWHLVGSGISGIYVINGAGYTVGDERATTTKSLQLLANLEGHNLRIHGLILMSLAMLLAHCLWRDYTPRTRFVLIGIVFYSLVTSCMIFGSWFVYPINFVAPWWSLLVAFLAGCLLVLAPSVLSHPSLMVELETGSEAGGEGV